MNQSKEWLIKSAGEIKGPYSYEEIVDKLKSKEIILVDEIAKSFNRWKYVRDEGVFEKIILEIKNLEDKRSEITFTQSDTDAITQEVGDKVVTFQQSKSIEDQIQEHFQKSDESKTKNKKENFQQSEVFVYENDKDIAREKNNNLRLILSFLTLLIFSFLAYSYLTNTNSVMSYEESKSFVLKTMHYNQFDKSKKLFEQLSIQNPSDDEIQYYLAFTSLQMNDSLTAEKILNQLKTKNSRFQTQVLNLLGIIQLKNYNLKLAKEYFDQALIITPQYVPSFYNNGIVDFLENRFLESHQNFASSMIHGGLDGIILLMNVDLLLNNAKTFLSEEEFLKRVIELQSLIIKHLQSFEVYKQELLIGLAALQSFIASEELVTETLIKALQVDPELTSQHVMDITFYRDVMTWNRILNWVKALKQMYPKNNLIPTLVAYSMFKGNEKIEGKSIIESRLTSSFLNLHDHIIHGYILYTLNRIPEAEVSLSAIPENKKNQVVFNLLAQICLKRSDYPCAQKNLDQSLQLDSKNISTFYYLAEVFFSKNNLQSAAQYLDKAYKLSPSFKPVLNLKYKMEVNQ